MHICIKAQQRQLYFIHHTPERMTLDEGCCWFRRSHFYCSYTKHNWRSRRCIAAMLKQVHTNIHHTYTAIYLYMHIFVCLLLRISSCLNTLAEHRQRCDFALPNHAFAEKYATMCVCVCEVLYMYVVVCMRHFPFRIPPVVESCWCFCGVYVAFECNKCICCCYTTHKHTYIHI